MKQMEQVVLPELYCPFPPVNNEHADTVHRETVEWAWHFGLLSNDQAYHLFRGTNIGRLAARFHPDALREDLRLLSDWYAWMFLRDDRCDDSEIGEHPEHLAVGDARFLEVLKGEEPTRRDEPLTHAMHDLRRRLFPRASDAWTRRFLRTVREHFQSSLWEATNRARGVVPDLETYIRMRRITGGILVDLDLIEVIEGLRLPPETRQHHTVRSLARASNNVACWANDLFSLEKELERGDVHNLVVVLRHAEGLTLQEAINLGVRMHNAEVHRFVELESRLPAFGRTLDAKLARYVKALRTRMRGNLDWARESQRYRRRAQAGPVGIATEVA
jgi:5-epi-alpha-selinene synthase